MAKITAEKLNAELAKNTVLPVYLLTGEDVYRKNLVIQKIREILHPDDFKQLEAHLRAALPNPKVEWLPDPSVPVGGCLVESQGAKIDGSIERRWQRAVAALGLVSTWYEGAPHDN